MLAKPAGFTFLLPARFRDLDNTHRTMWPRETSKGGGGDRGEGYHMGRYRGTSTGTRARTSGSSGP
jgi:hypothetical protein